MNEDKTEKQQTRKPGQNYNRMKAISLYSPRIVQQKTVKLQTMAQLMATHPGLTEGAIMLVLKQLMNQLVYHFSIGQGVQLDVLGTFTPVIKQDGTFTVKYLPSVRLKSEMNKDHWYKGNMNNRDMIGKSSDDMVARWNEEHPDDPID